VLARRWNVVVNVATKPGTSIVLALVVPTTKPWIDVGARRAERDGHLRRHDDALRLERVLLRDERARHAAVGATVVPRLLSTNSPSMCSVRGSMVSTRDGGIAAHLQPVTIIIATSSAMMIRR
jgi:hypothetical protein